MLIEDVCRSFRIEGELIDCETIKTGNINNTYKVLFRRFGEDEAYIIQRINTYVFRKPEQIMSNISKITRHMREEMISAGENPHNKVLHYLHTEDMKYCIYDENHGVWRGYRYISDSVTYDVLDSYEKIFYAGQEFGDFQMRLSNFDAAQLYETIPDFHNTKKRLEKLFNDIETDPCNRVSSVREEIAFIEKNREIASMLSEMLENGEIPLRVVHNDTKCNNILFDINTNKPLAVIDLDTVMPGLTAYDFGDAVRSLGNTSNEDEKDLTKVSFDIKRFDSFAKGFLGQTCGCLTQKELDTLVIGAITITVELASRFLDDYITGDKYFKIKYEDHNIDRARCQIALAKDMLKKRDEMEKIVRQYCCK